MSAMPSIATTVAAHEIAEYNTGYANARSPLSNHLVTRVLDTAVKTRNEIALAAESWNVEVGVSSVILMLVVGALQTPRHVGLGITPPTVQESPTWKLRQLPPQFAMVAELVQSAAPRGQILEDVNVGGLATPEWLHVQCQLQVSPSFNQTLAPVTLVSE